MAGQYKGRRILDTDKDPAHRLDQEKRIKIGVHFCYGDYLACRIVIDDFSNITPGYDRFHYTYGERNGYGQRHPKTHTILVHSDNAWMMTAEELIEHLETEIAIFNVTEGVRQ